MNRAVKAILASARLQPAVTAAALLMLCAPAAAVAQQATAYFPVRDSATSLTGIVGNPWCLALGDLDGDGLPDAVTANEISDTISILRARPTGGFQLPVIATVGDSPRALAFGDLDADGNLDIVVACFHASAVCFVRGDGAGGVLQTITLALGISNPFRVAIADLDGNGWLDVVACNTGSVSVLRSVGGVFQSAQVSAAGSGIADMALADVVEDGLPDLVVAEAAGITVRAGTGLGSFGPPQSLALTAAPLALALGELNGDGHVDVVATVAPAQVAVLLGDGAGAWTPGASGALPYTAYDVVLADMDFDSRLDVVCDSVEFAVVLRGDGAGGLLPASVGLFPSQLYIASLAVSDATADGRPDVLAASREAAVIVLPGDGLGGLVSMSTLPASIPAVANTPVAPLLCNLDGDSHLDLVYGDGATSIVQVRHGDGLGGLGAPTDLTLAASATRQVAAVDVHGDGVVDLVVASGPGFASRLNVFAGDGLGGFLPPAVIAGSGASSHVAGADMNGDGNVDLIAKQAETFGNLQIWLNDGAGSFALATGVGSFEADSMAVADVDLDGFSDVVLSFHQGSKAPKIYYGNGAGLFETQDFLPFQAGSGGIVVLDANEDGLPDLASTAGADVWLSLASAPRSFAAPTAFPAGSDEPPRGMCVTDLDLDGHADLVMRVNAEALSVLRGDGTGGLSAPLVFGAWNDVNGLAVGDADEDGRPDVVTVSREAGLSLVWDGGRIAVMPNRASSVGAWSDLGLGLGGKIGVPQLTGTGSLAPLSPLSLAISGARPFGLATLVIGGTALNAPFKGGTLVPLPIVLIAGLPLDGSGQFAGSGTWYGGLPPGISTYFQAWVQDPAGLAGFSASNGLRGLTP